MTESFATYKLACFDRRGARPEPGSVSHGFPSKTEALLYCQGADREWPTVM